MLSIIYPYAQYYLSLWWTAHGKGLTTQGQVPVTKSLTVKMHAFSKCTTYQMSYKKNFSDDFIVIKVDFNT